MSAFVELLGEGAGGERLPPDLRGALLTYLAYADSWLPREQVAFLFWPDMDEAAARRNLRQLLNRTKALDLSPPLEVEPSRLRWPVTSDVAELRRAVGRQEWHRVVHLYRGDLLARRPLENNAGFGAWLEVERENLRNTYHRALGRRAEELELAHDHAAAAAMLEPLLAGDDLAEEALHAYMRNAYLAGQRQAALSAYDRFARQLADDLGLEPLGETQELAATIRSAVPLQGVEPRQNRAPPLQVQRPPRLVGRDEAVAAVLTASRPVVLLSGEAGVGKSRLMEEVAPGAARARCLEGLQSVPLQAVADLVRSDIKRGWDPATLGNYREDLARLVPEALPGQAMPPAEPLTAKARLLEALARGLESAHGEAEGPFHLVFDDLQWADDDTLELLSLLADRGRLRLLGAFRRYETTHKLERTLAALASAGRSQVVQLEPLDEEQVRQLLATLIGAGSGPERFSRWLHGSSAGNVMFALETLKALFENGTLAADTKGWHSELDTITQDYREIEAPTAISDVILRRTERLGSGAVRTLQAAAVLGASFTPNLLAELLESSELAQQDALEELERSGMVLGNAFRHDLIRQSVYRAVAPGRRTLLHARAAAALAPVNARIFDTEGRIVVAEHLLAAGQHMEAARAFGRAASDLQEMGLLAQARNLLDATLPRFAGAVAATDRAPEGSHSALTLLQIGLAQCLVGLGELEAASRLVEEVTSVAATPELQGAAAATSAHLLLRTGQLEQAGEAAQTAMELGRRVGDRLLELNASSILAESAFHLGRYEQARRIVEANVATLREEDLPLALLAQLASLGAILDALGDHQAALTVHKEALEASRAMGARHQFVNVALNLVECYRELGDEQAALDLGAEALALDEVDGTSVLRNNLASLLLEMGRLPEAEAYCLENTQVADPTIRTLAWARLVRVYAHQGRDESLAEALNEAQQHAPLTEYPVARVMAAAHLLDHGTVAQRQLALELVADLRVEELPEYLKEDVLRIRAAVTPT